MWLTLGFEALHLLMSSSPETWKTWVTWQQPKSLAGLLPPSAPPQWMIVQATPPLLLLYALLFLIYTLCIAPWVAWFFWGLVWEWILPYRTTEVKVEIYMEPGHVPATTTASSTPSSETTTTVSSSFTPNGMRPPGLSSRHMTTSLPHTPPTIWIQKERKTTVYVWTGARLWMYPQAWLLVVLVAFTASLVF